MDRVTRSNIVELSEVRAATCASLFLRTHRRGNDVRGDRLRFRQLLGEAREKALMLGRERAREVDALLEPGWRLAEDDDAWRGLGEGLAVFLAPDLVRTLRLPLELRDLVVVGDRLHVKPLLPLLHGREPFHILALSRKQARLLAADPDGAWEVEVPGMPAGVAEVERWDDKEKTLQYHAGPSQGGARGPVRMFHGQGGVGTDDPKVISRTYCRLVERQVAPLLREAQRPLVLVGEDALLAQFREVCRYPQLLAAQAPGSPDRAAPDELLERTLPLVQPQLEASRREALRRYGEASTLAVDGLEHVLPHALAGRVGVLFVAADQECWGRLTPDERVELREVWAPGDVDLLDVAASATLRHGGEVHALPTAQLPAADGPAAAVLRY